MTTIISLQRLSYIKHYRMLHSLTSGIAKFAGERQEYRNIVRNLCAQVKSDRAMNELNQGHA